jgi:CRISPR-associated protein Cas1
MSKSLPSYLKNFTCYLLRVQFSAQKEVEIKENWLHLPSYALGDALMNSKRYRHLHDTLFKPTQGRFKNIPSRIIVRADGTKRSKFSKNEILNLYVTIVGNNRQEIVDFINFLPEWAGFHFFKANSFRFHSSYLFNPLSNEFEPSKQSDIKPLDYNFFNNRLTKWEDTLEIRFLTPTSYLKDQLLTDEVSYDDLIKRIQNRVLNLYFSFLAPTEEIDESSNFIFETNAVTLLNGLSFPRQMIIKKKKYNLSGLKGFVCYSVPYSYEEDYLLALAYYIHVGNNTIRGNGQIEAIACQNSLFAKYIGELKNEGVAEDLIEKIENHAYLPSTYRSVKIPKSDGSYRELEIPTTEDIMLQKTMASVLYPAIDRKMSFQNFAYRKEKGALAAVRQVQKWIKSYSETHFVIRCDIDNFFDTISIPLLLRKLYSAVQDAAVCHLAALWISSGKVNTKNQYEENTDGIPQGSAVSPLLANLYLTEFDRFIENKITKHFIRYADDILLLVPKEEKTIRVLQMLTDYLEANLQLNLNQEFYAGSLKDGFSFLGIEFECNGKLSISNDKKNRIDNKIKRALYLADDNDFSDLEKTVQGLKNYYGKLLTLEDKQAIDDIIVEVYRAYLQEKSKPNDINDRVVLFTKTGFITDKYADGKWGKQIKPKKQKKVPKPKNVNESLKIQKRKHFQAQAEEHELVVTLPGSFIGISKNNIQVKSGGKLVVSKPINTIRQISILVEGVTVSSYITKYIIAATAVVNSAPQKVSGVKFVEKQLLVGTPTEKQNKMLYVNGNNGMV